MSDVTTAGWPRDARWADALAVLSVMAPILLLSKFLRPLADDLGFAIQYGGRMSHSPVVWSRAAVWALVTVAVLWGARAIAPRVIALAGAWAAVLVEVLVLVGYDEPDPSVFPRSDLLLRLWPLLVSAIAAVLLSLARGPRPGVRVLGWRRVTLLGAAGLVAVASAIVPTFAVDTILLMSYEQSIEGPEWARTFGSIRFMAGATYVLVVALVLIAVLTLEAPVRRRVLALLAPIVALLAILQLGYDVSFSGLAYDRPLLSPGVQLIALVAVPPLVLAAGLLLVRLRDRALTPVR